MGHINLRAKRASAVGELACPHALEQIEALIRTPIAVWALFARLGQCASCCVDLLLRQVAHVCLALLDEVERPPVILLEVVRAEEKAVVPIRPHPADVLDDGIHVLLLFLGGVGVVKAQVEEAVEIQSDAIVNPDGLRMADVQVGVRLGRESGVDMIEPPRCQVLLHRLADEICRFSTLLTH